jgi:hypothetical protein
MRKPKYSLQIHVNIGFYCISAKQIYLKRYFSCGFHSGFLSIPVITRKRGFTLLTSKSRSLKNPFLLGFHNIYLMHLIISCLRRSLSCLRLHQVQQCFERIVCFFIQDGRVRRAWKSCADIRSGAAGTGAVSEPIREC